MATPRAVRKPRRRRVRAAHLGPQRRRPQVLDAALAIAVERGAGAVTLGAVAQRLGVTRPVVYACFDDRVDLLAALLDRETDALLASVLAALHEARGTDPEAVFVHGYRSLLRTVAQRPDSWRLVFAAQADPAVQERFARARAVVAAAASKWIRPALAAWWRMRETDRKLPALVELFMASCEAAMRVLLDSAGAWEPDALGELYGRAMCRAFSAA